MHGSQKVVFLVVQHVVAHRHARRHQFGHAAFHERFRQFRVFELVANGYAPPCANQFRQVGVECVMWKARHLCVARISAVVAPRERDAQNPRCHDSILAVGLVEVAAAKQQHRIGIFLLEIEKLFHHRRQAFIFRSHIFPKNVSTIELQEAKVRIKIGKNTFLAKKQRRKFGLSTKKCTFAGYL